MSDTCLIVYASMSGNTEEIANLIGEGINLEGIAVEVKDILTVDVSELPKYDGILLGAYTWGDGDLPDEFLDFYDELGSLNLTGKATAAFGSCDSIYEHRGRAVDLLVEKLGETGAKVVVEGLKIEHAPTEAEKEVCIQYGRVFSKRMKDIH